MSKEERPTPKVFISYSWSSPQHQDWVETLAKRLTSDGVDIILDVWMLKEGQDKYAFMERMVTDESVSKVLVICDSQYADKANKKKGGVGTESQIISKEVYEKVDQNKFVAVVTEYGEQGEPYVPVFLAARIFIDMSTEEKALENYEQLLRFIYDRPLRVKPALGTPPAYIFEEAGGAASKTAHKLAMLKRAVQDDRGSVPGLIADYLKSYSAALEDYRIGGKVTHDFDEQVVSSIEKFMPYRDEFVDFITFISTYRGDERTYQLIFEFFGGLLRYTRPPKGSGSWQDLWFDNYRFIIFELFLYNMAALLKNQRYEQANIFLAQGYLDPYLAEKGQGALRPYYVFDKYPDSLERMRKERLRLNFYYVTADILRRRAYHEEVNFDSLMQADFILYLRSVLNPADKHSDFWEPRTAGYAEHHGALEIFAKAESKRFFKNLMILLNVESKQDLEAKFEAAVKEGNISRHGTFRRVYVERLINLEKLDTFQ